MTRLHWLHGAAFMTCHLIRFMSGLPLPRSLYLAFHDWTEPPLRRWCECRPHCWCRNPARTIYNAAPAPLRLMLLIVTFPWGRRP